METGKGNTKDFSRPTLRIFLEYFKPHMGLFVLDLTCALIASAVDLVFPLVARHAMYHMLPDKAFAAFFHVMVIVGIAFLLKAIMHYIITYWGHMFGVRVEADLRDDLFAHMQSLDFNFFNKNRTGQLLSRMTGDLFEVTEMAHHGPEDLFIASITIVGAVIIMFTIQWKLALVILILLPIALTVVMLNRRRMIRTSRKVKEKLAEINGEVESGLSGVRTSKAFANEATDYAKFAAANDEFRTAKCENYKAFGLFASSLEFFMSIMPVVIMAVGGWIIMRNEMNYADLVTFYLYIATFITPIRKLAGFMETFMNGWAGLTRFVEIMRLEPEVDVAPGTGKPMTAYDIDIDNISFAYQEKNTDVINGISLHVAEGETVAIVGPSGGGKTTLCQLIPRFYDVDEGSIQIGGTDIREIEKKTLRKNIGIVQ